MFGTALYHPYIDIKDESLLRSAILFWDEIQTIVPTSIEHPYNNRSSKICEAEGYLKPLRCNLHGHLLNELGNRVLNMIQDSSGPLRIKANASSGELLHAQKFGDRLRHDLRLARIHPEKMSPELRALFPGESQGDGDWLLVNSQFADASMAALAAVLA